MSFNPLISLARNAKRQRMEMQCDPQWVLDLAAERDQLRAELEVVRGQQPDAWPTLDKPAKVGPVRFNPGLSARLVVEAAQRQHEYSQEPEVEAARLERFGAFMQEVHGEQPDAVSVPRELLDVGHLIRTQDNRCTDAPLFAVMKKRPIVASPDHDYDYIEWVNVDNDYAVASEVRARRLEALYEGCRDIPEGWERFAMKEIDVFVTACFTEQGCKDFLARDGHNHRKPFIYAFGSYRNAEFRAVRDWLAALPSTKNAEEV